MTAHITRRIVAILGSKRLGVVFRRFYTRFFMVCLTIYFTFLYAITTFLHT